MLDKQKAQLIAVILLTLWACALMTAIYWRNCKSKLDVRQQLHLFERIVRVALNCTNCLTNGNFTTLP